MNDDLNLKIKKIFCETLGVEESEVSDETAYNSFRPWDSLKHLQLVSILEEEFDIEFEMDDIVAMETFGLIKEFVARYLN